MNHIPADWFSINLQLKLAYPLKLNGWKMTFPFGMAYFRGLCSFQGGKPRQSITWHSPGIPSPWLATRHCTLTAPTPTPWARRFARTFRRTSLPWPRFALRGGRGKTDVSMSCIGKCCNFCITMDKWFWLFQFKSLRVFCWRRNWLWQKGEITMLLNSRDVAA